MYMYVRSTYIVLVPRTTAFHRSSAHNVFVPRTTIRYHYISRRGECSPDGSPEPIWHSRFQSPRSGQWTCWRYTSPSQAATLSMTADLYLGFLPAIGNTPLIRLNRLSQETGCEILGKAEFMNPGGSIKDRAALYVVKDAEEKGLLRPGGTVVEGT